MTKRKEKEICNLINKAVERQREIAYKQGQQSILRLITQLDFDGIERIKRNLQGDEDLERDLHQRISV